MAHVWRENELLMRRAISDGKMSDTNLGAVNIVGGSCCVTVALRAALSAIVLF